MNPSRLIYTLIFVFWVLHNLPYVPVVLALLLAALAAARGMWLDTTVLGTVGRGLLLVLVLRACAKGE